MAKVYTLNRTVAETAAKLIAENHITRFHSQNALYIFMEDIKNPWIKNNMWYTSRRKTKQPGYAGSKNYDPSIKYLISKGVLTKHIEQIDCKGGFKWNKRITFEVNKQSLTNFLQTL